jgi:hypothetical protein
MVVVVFFYLASAVLHLVAFFRLEATFTTILLCDTLMWDTTFVNASAANERSIRLWFWFWFWEATECPFIHMVRMPVMNIHTFLAMAHLPTLSSRFASNVAAVEPVSRCRGVDFRLQSTVLRL